MGSLPYFLVLTSTIFAIHADERKTYRDMFSHTHSVTLPPIPGWNPESNPWDDYLYPPIGPRELTRRKGKPIKVRLTSDSPAMNGSSITFTAALEYPKCHKEDANGDLVYDDNCQDAYGQVRSGYLFNRTSWLEDYGFGKCTDMLRCNVFPDGRPFPQSSDWRRRGYVYVWHTMGHYFETFDGSSSSVTLNTSDLPLGAEVMEVLVYRRRERRKYSPLATDDEVYFITDTIPLAVNISQKAAVNQTRKMFLRGSDVVFHVFVHDPSGYLKTAAAVNYIWDFRDGNRLITHKNVATHAYSALGNVSVKLTVEAAFRIMCPLTTPTPVTITSLLTTADPTHPSSSHAVTSEVETSPTAPVTSERPAATPDQTTAPSPLTADDVTTTGFSVTSDPKATPTAARLHHGRLPEGECFRYLYGAFQDEIAIVEPGLAVSVEVAGRILDVTATKGSGTVVNFVVKCLGRMPRSVCTITFDNACRRVLGTECDDVLPAATCVVSLQRTFPEPGVYCVNVTLDDPATNALGSTVVNVSAGVNEPTSPNTPKVVLSSSAVLAAIIAFVAFMLYKRYKVYRPVRRSRLEDANAPVGQFGKMRTALSSAKEEKSRLLADWRPLWV